MIKKIVTYENGQQFVMHGCEIGLVGENVIDETDVTDKTDKEIEKIKSLLIKEVESSKIK